MMINHAEMRSLEAARRRQLIEATIDTVADLGFRAASLSEIARRANVSQGLFAHYFGDKDGLLEATLRYMAARLPRVTAIAMRKARTPLERLYAVSDTALADAEFERRTSAVWLAFWGQILHSEPNRRVQAIYQRRMRSNLKHGLRGVVRGDAIELCATLIAAAIDGLWLQSHAASDVSAADARASVRRLIGALIEAQGPPAPERLAPSPSLAASPSFAPDASDPWREASRDERAATLRRMAEAIRSDRAAIAKRLARDTGAPVADTEAHDLPRAARAFERACEAARRPTQTGLGFGAGFYGVVEACAQGPAFVAAHSGVALAETARAVALGLSQGRRVLICSPDERTQALSRFVEALEKAGDGQGLVALIGGREAEIRLQSAGTALMNAARRPSKAAAVIVSGADLSDAAAKLVRGPRAWARARSFSETLVFVEDSVREAFVSRLVGEAASLSIGDPREPDVEVGPLGSAEHLGRTLGVLQEIRADGGRVRLGGRAHETSGRARHVFLKPTVAELAGAGLKAADRLCDAPVFIVAGFRSTDDLPAVLRPLGAQKSLVFFGPDQEMLAGLARSAGEGRSLIDPKGEALPASAEDWLFGGASNGDAPEIRIAGRRGG